MALWRNDTMGKSCSCKKLRKKIELLREELNASYFSISQEELLKKSMVLDVAILKYIKMQCRIELGRRH